MYKLVFFVPKSHLEAVKSAVFQAGGGKLDAYKDCCWQVAGVGQFLPLEGADPYIGKPGSLEIIEEYRVEIVVQDLVLDACIAALKLSHPYEVPAYDVLRLESVK